MNEVKLFFLEPVAMLKSRTQLKKFIQKVAKKNGRPILSLNVIFCSDEYLLNINKQYLQHDYYTDIITFDLSENKKSAITAELYISIDRVRDNAKHNKTPFYNEIHRVIFHGLLHLLGYKDKLKKDKILMKQMEDKLLADYFC
jgi:probable rRNA maturation factor